MKSFSWGDIEGGFRGFEHLAVDYVRSEFDFPGSTWEHTPETRDGNHDAVSLVLGFQPNAMQEEWWMEAKYSTKKSILTRYRLDATIVSAALQKNVSKVVFVTNIKINTKTNVDIRSALQETLHCGSVHFCTKDILEYWLKAHHAEASRYFPNTDLSTLAPSPLFVTDEIEVYSDIKLGQSFCEALNHVQMQKEYYLYFSIFSSEKQTFPVTIDSNISGILLCEDKALTLLPGENQYVIKVLVSPDFHMHSKSPNGKDLERTDALSGALLQIGSLEVLLKQYLSVLPAAQMTLLLPSQQNVLQTLEASFSDTRETFTPALHCLLGGSAEGKTYIMEQFSKNLQMDQNVLHISFSSDRFANDKYIYCLTMFCLFPYLPPDMITCDYLHELQGVIFPNDILNRLVIYQNTPEELHKLYASSEGLELFPSSMSLNLRVILLDDLQKVDSVSLSFLFSVLLELIQKKQPVFFLMNAWPNIQNRPEYEKIKALPAYSRHFIKLTGEDVSSALKQTNLLQFPVDAQLLESIFPNVIELLAFLQYVGDQSLDDIESLITTCRFFSMSDTVKASVIGRFNSLFSASPKIKELCMQIYWSVGGIETHTPMTETERCLLASRLAKIEPDTGKMVSYHDMYRNFFCQAFPLTANFALNAETDAYAKMRWDICYEGLNKIKKTLSTLQEWRKNGKYYSILYVLEGFFGVEKKDDWWDLMDRLGEEIYYALLFQYGYAVANTSRTTSGKLFFTRIARETSSSKSLDTLLVRMDALFELLNSDFEWLERKNARIHMGELREVIYTLQKFHKLPEDENECEKYILSKQIELLMYSEAEEPHAELYYRELEQLTSRYHYCYEKAFFRLRYAETLYWRATDTAAEMAKQSRGELLQLQGPEEKFYLWAKMDCAFLKFVMNDPTADLEEMQSIHKAMRQNLYNDYRKRRFAMACVYYQKGLVYAGNDILLSDAMIYRELRPRQKAFYHETMALYQALNGNPDKALENLEQAKELFAMLPSYLPLIRHNKILLESGGFSFQNIEFCRNGQGPKEAYWIDPRCIW